MDTAPRRVLHLHGRHGTRVHADGTALKIEQAQQSPVWMPRERIAVLVIQGPVDINSQTIATVLNAGAAVRLLAADGTALGDLEARPAADAISAGDWRPLYEQWLVKRSLTRVALEVGSHLLGAQLRPWLGAGSGLLKALGPVLGDTARLRQNATHWVHRAVDLIEDAQGGPGRGTPPPPPAPGAEPSTAAPSHLQRWLQQQQPGNRHE